MSKISNRNHYTVEGWMLNELNLKGIELLVYAIIYGFSQSVNYCFASVSYLEDFTGASRPTVIKALHSLMKKGYIKKVGVTEDKTNVYMVKNLDMVKNFTDPSKETLPKVVKNFTDTSKETLPNIYTDSNSDIDTDIYDEKREQKHRYGEYKNVLLTDSEKEKLNIFFGSEKEADDYIQFFSESKKMNKKYKYDSDYLAIRRWKNNEKERNKNRVYKSDAQIGKGMDEIKPDEPTFDF